MNAIHYECVNERKKNFKKSGGGRTYNHVFTSPLLYIPSSPIHPLTLIKQIFILKVNHAQFKQNNYKMWKVGREPWTFG